TDPVATRDGVRFRVDHLALAVRSIDATLAWFRRIFPVEAARPKQLGWDGAYNFQSFRLAGYKMELIESARPASFVERFLARRGVRPRLSPSACRHARVHALRAPAGRAAPGNAGYGARFCQHPDNRRVWPWHAASYRLPSWRDGGAGMRCGEPCICSINSPI